MTFLTSIILVPLTTAKCLLSLLTFCLGIVNTMKTDRLQEKRGVGTSTSKNVRDLVMTVILSVIPLAGIVFHIGFLIMTSMITVFSWSWTEESPQPHHFCFLLPFLPFCLAFIFQFMLFQKYVRPRTSEEQRFAFLSLIIPVRVHLIKDKDKAFMYYTLSVSNIWGAVLLSFLLLIAAVSALTLEEDSGRQLLIMAIEFVLPQVLWEVQFMLTTSLLLWYFVISPSLSSHHFCPDYQNFQDRLATFPFYWSNHFCNMLLQERLNIKKDKENGQDLLCINPNQETQNKGDSSEEVESMRHFNMDVITEIDESSSAEDDLMNRLISEIKDNATPQHFASSGFFYSHPRMTGLQVSKSSFLVFMRS